MIAQGLSRRLPAGSWVVDEGTANVALGAEVGAAMNVRGVRPGLASLRREGERVRVVVVAGGLRRGEGEEPAREAPFAGRDRFGAFVGEPVHAVVRLPREFAAGAALRVVAFDARGAFTGEIAFDGSGVSCADDASLRCFDSGPLRLVSEALDGDDVAPGERAIEARLGGRLAVLVGSDEVFAVPTCLAGEESCGYDVTLRPLLVRAYAGGPTVFRGAPEGEVEALRERLASVMKPWETCGIRASVLRPLIVDPPRDVLLAFGLPFGLPSDGREVIEVKAGRRTVEIALPPKLSPRDAARVVEERLRAIGVEVLSVERPWLVHEERPAAELRVVGTKVEPSIRVRHGGRLAITATRVELRDGLEHFDDARAASGSQEERALLVPLVDGLTSTVDVVAVPFFSDGRRVGESFIATDDAALANVIVVDRAGLAASRTSHVLAHELGHVLLRSGDHPDEGIRDTPRLLMDSDASDASRLGPRLLTADECARARTQGQREPHRVLTPFARPSGY